MKNKELHCTSIDCDSRRSKCCGEESTSYFKCSSCGGEFIAKEHSCSIATNKKVVNTSHVHTPMQKEDGSVEPQEKTELVKNVNDKPEWEEKWNKGGGDLFENNSINNIIKKFAESYIRDILKTEKEKYYEKVKK